MIFVFNPIINKCRLIFFGRLSDLTVRMEMEQKKIETIVFLTGAHLPIERRKKTTNEHPSTMAIRTIQIIISVAIPTIVVISRCYAQHKFTVFICLSDRTFFPVLCSVRFAVCFCLADKIPKIHKTSSGEDSYVMTVLICSFVHLFVCKLPETTNQPASQPTGHGKARILLWILLKEKMTHKIPF